MNSLVPIVVSDCKKNTTEKNFAQKRQESPPESPSKIHLPQTPQMRQMYKHFWIFWLKLANGTFYLKND